MRCSASSAPSAPWTPEQVQAVYKKAIALGGQDEGPPGTRFGNFFAAYFRDLDGNKLNCFCLVNAQLGD
jgi:predicted lactoylglutathione lyase